ncbi:MAG: T9SS type A sorting domain-containing protein [Bacteroidetes bacterium]|nr:T9SS type A sorting domain-containing protein [Bacteroidota bacterium]
MNKLLLFTLSLLLNATLFAYGQTSNCLQFDNIDDNVTVPNGSSLISNSNEISLSFWVYPENAFPAFPDFDGFAGIRNNFDGDFYILQLTATDVEARFRNSAGTAYDIVFSGLTLNTWQHFVLTYDGTTLALFHNGAPAGTLPATGVISNPSLLFNIGNLDFQGTQFYTNGKFDEVSLWNTALTQQQITCIYTGAIDPLETGLQLYYRFNQGIAAGSNGTVTTLLDATGSINGVLNGFALAGSVSNWVAGFATANSATINDLICPGTTYTFGTQTLTAPGTYYQAFPTTSGCDSVVELILTAPTINTTVGQIGPILTAQQSAAAYQWIDCLNGNTVIAGAINQTYTATANGQYAVVVTLGSCADTSVCVTVTNVGLNELATSSISVSPNPFSDNFIITNESPFAELNVTLYDALGKKVMTKVLNDKSNEIAALSSVRKGTYWLFIAETNQRLMLIKK